MKWINVKDNIPSDEKNMLRCSKEVLCQNSGGQIFIGYVKYDVFEEFQPQWIQSGRDMYYLEDVIKWISLGEILNNIS